MYTVRKLNNPAISCGSYIFNEPVQLSNMIRNSGCKNKMFNILHLLSLIVFAPFLIKSPKQSLGDLLFLHRFLLLFLFLLLLFLFFLSAKHELVHGRSQELQDRIS